MRGTNINNLIWYADIMERLNQKEEVLTALEQAYQLSNQNVKLIVRLAKEYVAIGKTENAVELLNALLERPVEDFVDFRNAAITYLRIGLNEKALEAYKLGLETLNTPSVENQIELVYLMIINNLWGDALPTIQNLIDKNQKYRFFLGLEGVCLMGLNQFKAASSAYTQAIASDKLLNINSAIDLFVPQDWIERYENLETLLILSAHSSIKTGDFENSLKFIDYAIKNSPTNGILNLFGMDLSLQLNDFELANKYKLVISNSNSLENEDFQLTVMQGLFSVHSFLTGRENKIDTKIMDLDNSISNLISICDHMDKGDFIKAGELFISANEKDRSENNLYAAVKETNEAFVQIWNNTLNRLRLIAAMRLYEYGSAEETLENWQTNGGSPLEISYYRANLILEYRRMVPVFENLRADEHIVSGLNKYLDDTTILETNLETANGQGKTKALKDLEMITIETDTRDIARLQSILFSTNFPSRLKFHVISDLLKLNNFELVEKYLTSLSTQVLDFIMYGSYGISDRAKEIINIFEAKEPICDPIFFKILSLSYAKITNYSEALAYSGKAFDYWQVEENWEIDNANLYEIMGDSSTAINIWKSIINKSNHKESIIYSYFELLLKNGQVQEVINLLSKHKKILYGSFDYFLTSAKANFQIGNFENAVKMIEEAKKINDGNLEINLLEGKLFLNLVEYEKAIQKAEDIIKVDPGYEDAYLLLISIYLAKNKLQEAIKVADNGLNHCKNGAALKMAKASILQSTGREPEALQLVSQISTADPTNFAALTLLANLYQDLGDLEAAETTAKKSIRISQNQPELQLLLGRISSKKGNLDQAIEYLSKSAALVPYDVEACLEIGQVYLEQQDLASALDAFKEAIERKPKDHRAYYQAGLIMKEIKDYHGAEKMLKLSAELAPKDANIRRQLAGVMALNFVHSPMEAN